MSWITQGTVNVTNGNATVYGTGTNWVSGGIASPGDAFIIGNVLYQVQSIQSDTQLTLATPYVGSSSTGTNYAIIPLGLLPSTLAQQLLTLQKAYLTTISQLYTWETQPSGTAPLTNPATGVTSNVPTLPTITSLFPPPANDTGAVNAYAANVGAITSYAPGTTTWVTQIKNTNTGPATLALSGLAALPINGPAGAPLQGGEIGATYSILVRINAAATAFELVATTGGSLPVKAATQSGQAVNLGQANSLYAPIAGNSAQTFAVANATQSDQAVNLGQLENASVNANLSGLAVTQNITSLPANYDTNQVQLLSATNAKAGVTWNSTDPRILTAGLGPNGPFIRTATLPLDLTFSAGVLVPNATASNQAVNLGQLGNYNQVIAAFATGTLPSTCWGGVVQVNSGATVTLPTNNPPPGSKVVLFGNPSGFSVVSNSNQFIYCPLIGLTSTTGPTTVNVPDGGWIEITSRGFGEYDITGGSLLVFQNTASAFTHTVGAPAFNPTTSASLAGATAGSVTWAQYLQGAFKAFAAQALGYENNTTNSQTITFPTPFANTPVITTNTTGLSLSVSTTALTINAPNNTTAYSGIIEVKGF